MLKRYRDLAGYCCLATLLILISSTAIAQVKLKKISQHDGNILDMDEIRNISVDNKTSEIHRIQLTCNINDSSGRRVLEYNFPPFMMKPGMQFCNFMEVDSQKLIFNDSFIKFFFKENHAFPPGNYTLFYNAVIKYSKLTVIPLKIKETAKSPTGFKNIFPYKVIENSHLNNAKTNFGINFSSYSTQTKSNSAIYKLRKKFTPKIILPVLTKPVPQIPASELKKLYFGKIENQFSKPDFHFHGTGSITYNFSPSKDATNLLPANFIITELAPTMSLYGIPFSAHFFLTMNPAGGAPFFNQINAGFDQVRFRDGLFKRMEGSIPNPSGSLNSLENTTNSPGKNSLDPSIAFMGNTNLSTSSFNNVDKALIQKYRYDREGLLRYRDSLNWTDPEKVKQAGLIADQLNLQNTLQLLKQQDAAQKQHFEDSLSKSDGKLYDELKDHEARGILQSMQKNDWPDNAKVLQSFIPLSKYEKFFYNFQELNIGKSYLNYTPLSIQGVSVTGENIAYNAGNIYVKTSAGILDMKQSLWFQDEFSRKYWLFATKVGWGHLDKSHIHLIYLDFRQKAPTIDTSSGHPLPNNNILIGVESVLKARTNLYLRLEYLRSKNIYSSLPSGDIYNQYLNNAKKKDLLSNDAAQASLIYTPFHGHTDISLDGSRIGAGYYTLGNPYLRTDLYNYGIRLGQSLLKHKIQLNTGFKEETDNLMNIKDVTSKSMRYNVGCSFAFSKLPVFNISYNPIFFYQRGISEVYFSKYSNSSNTSISSSYVINKNGVGFNQTFLFSNIINDNTFNNYRLNLYSYIFNESIAWKSSRINGLFSYSLPKAGSDSLRVLTIDFSYSSLIGKYVTQQSGLKINHTLGKNLPYIYSRTSFHLLHKFTGNVYIYHGLFSRRDYATPNDLIQASIFFTM